MAGRGVIDDPHYTMPIYHKAEAAHIIAVPAQTFRNWSVGYAYKRLDGSQVVSAPIVTTLEPARPHGVSVPFVGLAEAYIVAAFTKAGFYGVQLLHRDDQPWQTVEGIEFRSVTVEAFKGKQGPCVERNQAVVYKGPFREVLDDDNHRMERGRRYAVCDKTYNIYRKAPYSAFFEFIEPLTPIPVEEAKPFDCSRTSLRHPKETKGQDYNVTTDVSQCCDGGTCC